MKNRITELFKNSDHKLLSVFYTAGFPKFDSTMEIARHLQDAGADMIEIGVPFSDPIADGPVIQESNKTALDQGMTLKTILDQVKKIRKEIKIPIVLMGYINPIMQYGMEKFVKDASAAGVDGVILPDLPMDEFQQSYKDLFEKHGMANTFLISPTTSEERMRSIDDATAGFIYAVSSSSTTGAKGDFTVDQETYFKRLGDSQLKNPILVGFGISNAGTFEKASRHTRGAIVGSSFITLLKQSQDLKTDIHSFVKSIKGK